MSRVKISKEEAKLLRSSSKELYYQNNDAHLRERYAAVNKDGVAIGIEGNTEGWFREDFGDSFTCCVRWCLAA